MSRTADADPSELLRRHRPLLRYDSLEPYFADSAAEWTDNPGNRLQHADGSVVATATSEPGAPRLSLAFLGATRYGDGAAVSGDDRIVDPAHDYVAQARALHDKPEYANRVYGHWATGSDTRTWLAYWFFYFYNDYNLVGDLLPAGLHEGDWEMIQLRLDESGGQPDLAVYAQHTHAEARDWTQVEKEGEQPVVYPARGSHASYFTPGVFDLGLEWTGHWFDHADGKRPGPPLTLEIIEDDDPAYGWAIWPGTWGGTRPSPGIDRLLEDSSPRGPGGHRQWRDPVTLLDTVRHPPAPTTATATATRALPSSPSVSVSRAGADLRITYSSAAEDSAALIVAVASPGVPVPPTLYREPVDGAHGTVEIPAGLHDDQAYEVHVSVAVRDGRASKSVERELPPSPAAART